MIVKGRATEELFLGTFLICVGLFCFSLMPTSHSGQGKPEQLPVVKGPFHIIVFMSPKLKVKIGVSSYNHMAILVLEEKEEIEKLEIYVKVQFVRLRKALCVLETF